MSETLVWQEVNRLVERLTLHEQAVLVERLARRLAQEIAPARKAQSLRGAWKNKFLPDLDLDAELAEIRTAWQKELDDRRRGPTSQCAVHHL